MSCPQMVSFGAAPGCPATMRRKRQPRSFSGCAYKLLEALDTKKHYSISAGSIKACNSMMTDFLKRTVTSAMELAAAPKRNKMQTITLDTLNSALNLVFPLPFGRSGRTQLSQDAMSAGDTALLKFRASSIKQPGCKAHPIRKERHCNITFPPGMVGSMMRQISHMRVADEAAIKLAAVLQHLCQEMLQRGMEVTKVAKLVVGADRRQISQRFLAAGIKCDEELFDVFPGHIGRSGFVAPSLVAKLTTK